jgi:hypothetical protein
MLYYWSMEMEQFKVIVKWVGPDGTWKPGQIIGEAIFAKRGEAARYAMSHNRKKDRYHATIEKVVKA